MSWHCVVYALKDLTFLYMQFLVVMTEAFLVLW